MENKKIGLKLMTVDVVFHAFDYVLIFIWWQFINWLFDNQIIILIFMFGSFLGIMSQIRNFVSNFSEHWKIYRNNRKRDE